MRNKLYILFIFILFFAILPGCSNYKELNDLSIVVGMGIDYIPSKNIYEVILQTMNPSENTAQGMGSGATPVVSLKTIGKTISEAAANSAKLLSRENIYSHIELLIIGEQLAKKESLNFIFDVFERDASVRVNIPVLIARDSDVRSTMDILPSSDKIPVRMMAGKLRNSSNTTGEDGESKIYEIIEELSNLGSRSRYKWNKRKRQQANWCDKSQFRNDAEDVYNTRWNCYF